MDVKGLTLYHVKSHLQKYRLGKYPDTRLQEPPKYGTSTSLVLGGQSGNSTLNILPSNVIRSNKDKKSQKEAQGTLYFQLEAQKQLKCQEAQRKYLNYGLEYACNKSADHYMGGAAANTGDTCGEIMQHPAGFETVGSMLPFSCNQQDPNPAYDSIEAVKLDANHEKQQFSFQFQDTIHCETEGLQCSFQSEDTAHCATEDLQAQVGNAASLYQESFPVLAGEEQKTLQTMDEDPIDVYFVWDDAEPKTLDVGFNWTSH